MTIYKGKLERVNRAVSVIYGDPPWRYQHKGGRGAAENHYETMATADIARLPVERLAAPNAALFLWTPWTHLADALTVIQEWGFEYKTLGFVWIKVNPETGKFSMGGGSHTRANPEPCLLGIRGSGPKRLDAGIRNIIKAPRANHSAKPPVVREMIDKLYGDVPKLELFARGRIPWHWSAWAPKGHVQQDPRPAGAKRELA